MKFSTQPPVWKGKPKASPLDNDKNFIELLHKISSGYVDKTPTGAGVYINQAEQGKQWGVLNAWRTVRDHLNRKLDDMGLRQKYVVTARQTADEGVWAVWVTKAKK